MMTFLRESLNIPPHGDGNSISEKRIPLFKCLNIPPHGDGNMYFML